MFGSGEFASSHGNIFSVVNFSVRKICYRFLYSKLLFAYENGLLPFSVVHFLIVFLVISTVKNKSNNFYFSLIGTYIERADNTARIVDVKYYVLLPSVSYVGTSMDNYQWESLLRSVSAHRSYRWVYDAEYKPSNVTDYLILNQRMPRSLAFCYRNIVDNLTRLADDYGARAEPHALADAVLKSLRDRTVSQIIDNGLHEFLLEFIGQNNRLGSAIAEAYNFN